VNDYGCDQHVYIGKKTKHRMENKGTVPASVVEIQTGDYFGDDDIIRYEDDYGRV
jgi:mannose-1-phosphate guanylyltransferase/mannose-6-phosphate isomerase